MGSLLKRSKAIRSQLKTRPQVASALLIQLRQQETAELIRTQTFTENLNYKSRIKRLLDKKGMKAQQLFWNLINRKPKTKSYIEALEGSAGLEIDSDRKNSIEGFLDKKIITSYNQADIRWKAVGLDEIGTPDSIFSNETADNMMTALSKDELD